MEILNSYKEKRQNKQRLMSSWSEFILIELEKDFLSELPSILRLLSRHLKMKNIDESTSKTLEDLCKGEFSPELMSSSVFIKDINSSLTVGDYLELSLNRILYNVVNFALSHDTFDEEEASLLINSFDAIDFLRKGQYLNITVDLIKERY